MSFQRSPRQIFGPEHDAFRQSVRDFLRREAMPRAESWTHEGVIDREFWKTAAAQGLVGFSAPLEYGGLGISDFRYNAVLDEEVVYSGIGIDAFNLTNDIVGPYLIHLTTEEQKARWLPGLTDGSLVPAIAMSEPSAGSDLRGIKARAVLHGDHFVLSGSKTFITSGIQADLVIVAAQVEIDGAKGIGLFVVEADMQGFSRGRKLRKNRPQSARHRRALL